MQDEFNAGLSRINHAGLGRFGGHHPDLDAFITIPSQGAHEVEPRQSRHMPIGNDQIGQEGLDHRQRLQAVRHGVNGLAGVSAGSDGPTNDRPNRQTVVDNHESLHDQGLACDFSNMVKTPLPEIRRNR